MKTTSWENCLPNNVVQFLSVDEVLEIHSALIGRFGGAAGVRDMGLLESALYRPQSGYYEDLVEMAAAMFESLINNHPFTDGNKRVAFSSTDNPALEWLQDIGRLQKRVRFSHGVVCFKQV